LANARINTHRSPIIPIIFILAKIETLMIHNEEPGNDSFILPQGRGVSFRRRCGLKLYRHQSLNSAAISFIPIPSCTSSSSTSDSVRDLIVRQGSILLPQLQQFAWQLEDDVQEGIGVKDRPPFLPRAKPHAVEHPH
jgi:hypothetical protein